MKQFITLTFLMIALVGQSQNLEHFIPADATAVVEVSGDQIFNLIDHAELEAMLPPDQMGQPMDLTQYGVDIKSKAYYFYQDKEGIGYQNVIVKLSDVAKAEELVGQMSGTPAVQMNGYNFVLEGSMTAAWNNNMAFFSTATFPKKVYTMEELIAEKEAEKAANQQEDSVEAVDEDDEYEYESEDDDDEMLEFELMMKNMEAPTLLSDMEISKRMTDHFTSVANNSATQSIANNKSYTSGKNAKASAYFWVNNFGDLIQDSYPTELFSMLGGGSPDEAPDFSMGFDAMSGNLVFDTDEIRMDFDLSIDPAMANIYKGAYDSKLAPSFLNHFNSNEALSYMSFTFDMEKTLQSYPEMAEQMYGSMLPGYKEEMVLVMDLMSVFLDEAAIGKLVTGDGLFVLHDFNEREVQFIDTEYDEDFNVIQVEKTKMEPIPNFTVMMGSENEDIISKLMKLGEKHGIAADMGGYHALNVKDMGSPFDLYVTHKNGIVFLTNSTDRLNNYATGKNNKNLGNHKNRLENNIFNLYLDISNSMSNLGSMLPADPETLEFAMENYKEMFITMEPMKDNKMGYDMVIKTNSEAGNSLKLIFDTIAAMQGGRP